MKSKDQILLEHAYQAILETELPQAAPSTAQAAGTGQPGLDKRKHLQALTQWYDMLRSGRATPDRFPDLHRYLEVLSRESQGAVKQRADQLSQLLIQTRNNTRGPQGRAAALYLIQQFTKEIDTLRALVSKS